MKKLIWNKRLIQRSIFLALLCFSLLNLNGQTPGKRIFTDNFEYEVGDIVGKGKWIRDGAAGGSNTLNIVSNGLTYENYQNEALGNAISTRIISGQKVIAPLEPQNSGSVYLSALMRVDSIKGTGADFFMAFTNGSSNASQFGKLYIKGDTTPRNFTFGVARSGLTNYGTKKFKWGETLLVVLKYEFVDGERNDKITVWINPTIGENEDATPYIQNKFTEETGAEIGSLGALMIRQSTTSPQVNIDAIRVATSWAALFKDAPASIETKISVIPSDILNFNTVYEDLTYTKPLVVKGENLTEDISINAKSGNFIKVSKSSISKENASSATGETLTITLVENHGAATVDTLMFTSEGAETVLLPVLWANTEVSPMANISTLRQQVSQDPNKYENIHYQLNSEVVVSHVYTKEAGSTYLQIFAQDENGAITITDKNNLLKGAYQVGDKFSKLTGKLESSFGSLTFIPERDFTAAISKNNDVIAMATTLAEIKANPGNFESRLISLSDVSFPNKATEGGGVFTTAAVSMTQEGTPLSDGFKLRILKGADFIGDSIPAKANIVGISTAGNGKLIAPRSKADIFKIKDSDPEEELTAPNLVENGSFEGAWTTSPMFGDKPEGWSVQGITGKETSIVKDGKFALKIVEANSNYNKIEQEISSTFHEGDTYEMKFSYYVLTSKNGNDIKVTSEWQMRGVSLHADADKLNNGTFFTSVGKWETKTILTKVPEGANSFLFNVGVAKGVVAIFDAFSFRLVPNSAPMIRLHPKNINTLTAKVDSTIKSTSIQVEGFNLTENISITLSGANADCFTLSKNEITTTQGQGKGDFYISYHPKTTGRHHASIELQSIGAKKEIIEIVGVASANTTGQNPKISISKDTLKNFTAKVGEKVVDSLIINASDLKDYLYISLNGAQKGHFSISTTMLGKTVVDAALRITYQPKEIGNHTAYIKFRSKDADTITLVVEGKATSSTEDTVEITKPGKFVLDTTHPKKLWVEDFAKVEHNKSIPDSLMQNVVLKWNRPWWGFHTKDENGNITEKAAKATGYIYQQEKEEPCEMWLLTPALDFKNSESKLFTFRVMGDFMFKDHQAKIELYYIEKDGDEHWKNKVEMNMPSTPEENGEWREFHIDLAGQNITDVFFMGFRFSGLTGSKNSVVYYIDDVSYGRKDVPQLSCATKEIKMAAPVYMATESSTITINARNLQKDITLKIGGSNPSKFELVSSEFTTNGGTFKVKFSPKEVGIHSAYIKVSSRGAADLIIPIEGRGIPNDPKIIVASSDTLIELKLENGTQISSKPIIVNPFLLTEDIQLSIEGGDASFFSISKTVIAKDAINENFKITYKPAEKRNHTAKIRLRSTGADDVIINVLGYSKPTSLENEAKNDLNIIRTANGFYVESATLKEISVYTISGQQVFHQAGSIGNITVPLKENGCYIIKTTTNNGVFRTKIIW